MIRRGFWLTAGAVTGIYGYRRVTAIGRRLSASLNPAEARLNPAEARLNPAEARLNPGEAGLVPRERRRTAIRAARETYRFTRDVREGMDLYTARHSAAAGSTLSTEESVPDKPKTTHEPEDGH